MKVYQLIFGHYSYDEGYVTSPGKVYINREDAEAAIAWLATIPSDPYAPYETKVTINEIEIENKFVPWISVEEIEDMGREIEEDYLDSLVEEYD